MKKYSEKTPLIKRHQMSKGIDENNSKYQNQKVGEKRQQYGGQQSSLQSMYKSNKNVSNRHSFGAQFSSNKPHGSNQQLYSQQYQQQYKCKVCLNELKEHERDFYPCNCKYKICYACYDIQVKEKERKCPNCFMHYKVNRVEEYKQTRLQSIKMSHKSNDSNLQCESHDQVLEKTNNCNKLSNTKGKINKDVEDFQNNHQKLQLNTEQVQNGLNDVLGEYWENNGTYNTNQDNNKGEEVPVIANDSSPNYQIGEQKAISNTVNTCQQANKYYMQNNKICSKVVISNFCIEQSDLDVNKRSVSRVSNSQENIHTQKVNIDKQAKVCQDVYLNFNQPYSDPNQLDINNRDINKSIPNFDAHVHNCVVNSKEQNEAVVCDETTCISQIHKLQDSTNPTGSSYITVEQIQPKIKTDEHIPIRMQEAENLIDTGGVMPLHHNEKPPVQEIQEISSPTVHQKYDLVSQNDHQDQEDLEQNLKNCNFQQINGPEPTEDSECMDIVSLRSSQTQNLLNNQLMYNQSQIQKESKQNIRRTNSQENRITSTQSQFLQQSSSQSGLSIPHIHKQNTVASRTNAEGNSFKLNRTSILSNPQVQNNTTGNTTNNRLTQLNNLKQKIKISKIRIIQKTTLYIIGISPQLADEGLMKKYEFFGQYGKILNITLNKDNAFNQNINSNLQCQQQDLQKQTALDSKSTSSSKSQISYAAYITYSTPEEASIAILCLDQYQYDGRMIRASYGRTKYCKYFLKNANCMTKDCPYQHKESKDSDILTPDDMQNKQLFSTCQQLALSISKIPEMTESQFKKFLKDKRENLTSQNNPKNIFPRPEAILENKDLMRKINNIKSNIIQQQNKSQRKQTTSVSSKSPREVATQPQDNQKKIKIQEQISDKISSNHNTQAQQLQQLNNNTYKNISRTLNPSSLILGNQIKKTRKNQVNQGIDSQATTPGVNNKGFKTSIKSKIKQNGDQNTQIIRQPRSGSHRHNDNVESQQRLQIIVGGGMRQSVTPRRHSHDRMLSQCRKEIQLGDIKKIHQNQQIKGIASPKMNMQQNKQRGDESKIDKFSQFILKQNKKCLRQSMMNLQQNVDLPKSNTDLNDQLTSEQTNSVFAQDIREILSGQKNQLKATNAKEIAQKRTNRLSINAPSAQHQKEEAKTRQSKIEVSKASRVSVNRRFMMHGERRNSVSKSIQRGQRDNSYNSLIDHQLKFLNDDMAITTNTIERKEPLIEKDIDKDYLENQSIISRMILQNQLNTNDQYDIKSSYQSNGDSRSYVQNQDLQQINNIYTSPFFLINSHKQNDIDSVYQIWEQFDSIEQTLKNMNTQSEHKPNINQFDSQSLQDLNTNKPNLIMPSIQNSSNPIKQINDTSSFNYQNNKKTYNIQSNDYSQNVLNFYGPQINFTQQQQQQQVQQPQSNQHMNISAKPFFSKQGGNNNNFSANNSSYGLNTGQVNIQQQPQQSLVTQNLIQSCFTSRQNQQYPSRKSQNVITPFMLNSGTNTQNNQQSNNNTQKGTKKNKNAVLNEKNLFLFDKQQDELFHKNQLLNNIFLTQKQSQPNEQRSNHEKMIAEQEQQNNIASKNKRERSKMKLITSQSVFSFPMGIDYENRSNHNQTPKKLEVDSIKASDHQINQQSIDNKTKKWYNHRNSNEYIDQNNYFNRILQKRNSIDHKIDRNAINNQFNDQRQNALTNYTNLTPQKKSQKLNEQSEIHIKNSNTCATKGVQKESKQGQYQAYKNKLALNTSINKQATEENEDNSFKKSNPFQVDSNHAQNINYDFDRKSAGYRFGTTAPTASSNEGNAGGGGKCKEFYNEFIKINDMFGGIGCNYKKRRNSCSKSISHSRVRMQPSIYHDGNEDEFKISLKVEDPSDEPKEFKVVTQIRPLPNSPVRDARSKSPENLNMGQICQIDDENNHKIINQPKLMNVNNLNNTQDLNKNKLSTSLQIQKVASMQLNQYESSKQ